VLAVVLVIMSESNFFVKMANNVLEAADVVAARLEESLTLVFSGDKDNTNGPAAADFGSDSVPEDDFSEEDIGYNPLQDMTDGVLGGILQDQVRTVWLQSCHNPPIEDALTLAVAGSGQGIVSYRPISRISISYHMVGTVYSLSGSFSNCHVWP
jgi:hypothetical protein